MGEGSLQLLNSPICLHTHLAAKGLEHSRNRKVRVAPSRYLLSPFTLSGRLFPQSFEKLAPCSLGLSWRP